MEYQSLGTTNKQEIAERCVSSDHIRRFKSGRTYFENTRRFENWYKRVFRDCSSIFKVSLSLEALGQAVPVCLVVLKICSSPFEGGAPFETSHMSRFLIGRNLAKVLWPICLIWLKIQIFHIFIDDIIANYHTHVLSKTFI